MKVVVTGAAGFIGANLVRALIEKGRDVRGVDSLSRGLEKNLKNLKLEVVHADLREYSQAFKAIEGAEVAYHLAARVGSIDYLHGSKEAELEALRSNLSIDANVLRACGEHGVKKVVYASSVSVYPIDKQQKLGAKFSEETIRPINPEGGYGWAKLVGELQLEMMTECKSAIARIFNAYGPYGEFRETAQVVPALVRKAINYPKEEFVVWGDGSQTRNLLYIGDCIDALLSMESHASYPPLVLNIGNQRTVTVKELAELIVRISSKDMRPKFDPSKPVGPISRVPDVTKARESIGWVPHISLEEGVKRTYDWMEQELASAQAFETTT